MRTACTSSDRRALGARRLVLSLALISAIAGSALAADAPQPAPAQAPMVLWPAPAQVEQGLPAPAALDTRPLHTQLGVALPPAVFERTLVLPPLDHAKLLALDAVANVGTGAKPLRVGIGRDLTIDPALVGTWIDIPADPARTLAPDGGRLYLARVTSMGAMSLRLQFDRLALGKGQLVAVSPATVPGPAAVYASDDPGLPDQLFTPLAQGDSALVEFFTPHAAPIAAPALPVGLQHMYRNITGGPDAGAAAPPAPPAPADRAPAAAPTLQPASAPSRSIDKGIPVEPAAGACNLDVTCYPTYNALSKAVGRMVYTSGGSSFLCSGQLLATTAADFTPYFLTANHCLSTAAEASSLQVFWLYQTATCNGADPGTGLVPTSSNASLLATGTSSDYTLLMMNGALPPGLTWAGWNSAAIANGTSVVAIHHPTGSFKRISFGTKNAAITGDCSVSGHIRATWSSGVTEGGSSGSGIFLTSSQAIIGTLHCGPSACGVPTSSLYDLYGAFATTYPNISSFLAAGADDAFAPNHTCATARVMTVPAASNTTSNLVLKSVANDFFSFTLPSSASLSASTTATATNGQVALQLLDTCGAVVANSSGSGNTQSITFTNTTGATRTYALRAYLTTDTRNNYSLTYSATLGGALDNDSCAGATVINPALLAPSTTLTGTTVGATADGSGNCVTNNTAPDRWFSLVAPRAGTLTLTTCGSAYDTVISVHSACPGSAANQLACDDDAATGEGSCGGSLQSYATLPVTAGTTYRIRVAGYNGASGAFTLNLTLPLPVVVACNPADIANTAGTLGPDGQLDNGDFSLFFTAFFAGCTSPGSTPCSPADIADTSATSGPDGTIDNGDFSVFFTNFFLGCP